MLKAAALICPRPVPAPLDLPDLLLSASCPWWVTNYHCNAIPRAARRRFRRTEFPAA